MTVTLSGYGSNDLDLVVLGTAANGACDPAGLCLGASATTNATEQLTFSAAANTPFYVVVEGYAGASSSFDLSVSCP